MTTARSRAIALLDDMTGNAYQQSCTAFVDAVLSAAEGRTQKTSGGSPGVNDPAGTIAPRDTGASTAATGAAAGPEDCGTDSDALGIARSWLDSRVGLSDEDLDALAREVVRLRDEREDAAGALATNVMSPDGSSVLGKLVPPSAFADAPASSDAAEDERRWWIVLNPSDGSVLGAFRTANQASVWKDFREIVEVVPAARAEAADAELLQRYGEIGRLHGRITGLEIEAARAESASRERDAALARAEAAEAKAQRRLDALYEVSQACRIGASPDRPEVAVPRGVREMLAKSIAWTDREKLRAAEARVRELESDRPESAWLIEMVRPVTNLYWTGDAFGTVDCAIRFARKLDAERVLETSVNQRDRCAVTGHSWMSLRPTASTADDGDEKEKTNG